MQAFGIDMVLFYVLIAGLLEFGVIVRIVVRAIHARAAGHVSCKAELAGSEGHEPILLHSLAACKRGPMQSNGFDAKDRLHDIR